MLFRNHQIDYFLQCRMKWKLKTEGWRERDSQDALDIGTACHAALAIWAVSRDQEKAFGEAFKVLEGKESEVVDTTFAVLHGYFEHYEHEPLTIISTETEFTVQLTEGDEYGGRTDGLVEAEGHWWVLENKTSGTQPGNFWKRYEFDRQTLGYVWAKRKKLGVPIHGVVVNVLFKPNAKRPKPDYDRRYFVYTEEQLNMWWHETLMITRDMKRAIAEDMIYRSGRCFSGFGRACEFYPTCSDSMSLVVLNSTHYQEIEVKEESK